MDKPGIRMVREQLGRDKSMIQTFQEGAQEEFDDLPQGSEHAEEAHRDISCMEAAANYIDKAAEQLAQITNW